MSWLPDLWGVDGRPEPVSRLEFQFRRKVLVEFHLRSVDDTLASIQDLWRYATAEWMSLRMPSINRQRTRWPSDPLWQEVQAIRVAPSSTGVVRRRLEQATLQRIVQGLWGYVTSLAALATWIDTRTEQPHAGISWPWNGSWEGSVTRGRRAKREGSVSLRPDGRWPRKVELQGRRRLIYGKTRKEANQKLARLVQDVEAGLSLTADGWLILFDHAFGRRVTADTSSLYECI